MSLKNFLLLNAILFVPFGLAMLLLPGTLFPLFGIDLDADGILMARVFASALLSIGLMCFIARSESPQSLGMRALLIGNFIFHALDALSTFTASYGGVMNSLGWMFMGLHFLLAVGFLFYLVSARKPQLAPK